MTKDLTSIKGIGEKRARQLLQLGVHTPMELIEYLPRSYLDFSRAVPVIELADGAFCVICAEVTSDAKIFSFHGMSIVSAHAKDATGEITLKWFNQPYRRAQVKAGRTVYAAGRVSLKKGVSMLNPSLSDELPGIVPVYHSAKGISQQVIRNAVFSALKNCWDEIGETLPLQFLSDHSLCARKLALRHAHFPANREILQIANRRLAFEDALLYQLAMGQQRLERRRMNGISFDPSGVRERFLAKLPFQLTSAQIRALDDLDADMRARAPMNRLLQGDVGSGKTVVALYALTVAAANGWQCAFLAPTEILAQQHYEQVRELFGDAAALLIGGMRKEAHERALDRIRNGTALCVVGTHALLQQSVRFDRLGLVVTDEQHRFGVRQRAVLEEKGVRPDVLVMSATPIPRTLALLMYGDLDITVIDELPPGRKPVVTRVIPESKRDDMYRYLAEQAKTGVQSFVVCPFIEEPETMDGMSVDNRYAELTKLLPDTRIAMLHGRMRDEVKNQTIEKLLHKQIDILVCTTLIEVGVHIPDAGIMVIENADRFGLAQLHQLRGRVGRSDRQAYCFLMSEADGDAARERLMTLTQTNDGFLIAQKDLEQRGPGEFLGTRQHGEAAVRFDLSLLEETNRAAAEIFDTPSTEHQTLIDYACRRYETVTETITMN